MAQESHVNRVLLTSQFFRGFKQLQKQRRFDDIDAVLEIIQKLARLESVDSYRPHPLKGVRELTELHVKPDLLLIYCYDGTLLKMDLYLEGLTTHDEVDRIARVPRNVKKVKDVNSDEDIDDLFEELMEDTVDIFDD